MSGAETYLWAGEGRTRFRLMIMPFRWTLRALTLACTAAAIPASFAANIWTKSSSGYWEEPYWSANHLPILADGPILFTNAGWKALAIGSGTTSNYPNSLRLSSLTVDAPVDSHNTLFLNWAQLSVPLHADSLLIGTNGSLESHFSAIDAGTFTVNGQASFADFGQSRFGTVNLGQAAPAELDLSNGWFSANTLIVARGAASSFNQSGGSNQVSGTISIDTGGSYTLSSGDLKAVSMDISPTRARFGRPPDFANAPRLNVTGGRAEVESLVTLGAFVDSDWQPGMMELSGGFFKADEIFVRQGGVTQTAGTNQLTQLALSPAEYDTVNYEMSGGRLESATVSLGYPSSALGFFAVGLFTQSSGVHSNYGSISANGVYIGPEQQVFTGIYNLSGGTLLTPAIGLDGGKIVQSGGTTYAQQLWLTNGGRYELSGGSLITSNSWLDSYPNPQVRSRFIQSAGEHRVQRLLYLENGGVYELHGGLLSADLISVLAGTQLRLEGGIVSSNNVLEMDAGALFLSGNYSLGWLQFNGTGNIIDFQSGSSIVHFTKVGYPPPALDGVLSIKNWKGSAVSPGQDQIYIDGTDQYIAYHLEGISFVDPAGYPPGNYRARRKASGEIVPLDRPIITFTRNASRNEMVLTWPDGYQLFSSAKVTGPSEPVANATKPWTIVCSDPQRFYLLRPAQ
jgi:hypothetical protein